MWKTRSSSKRNELLLLGQIYLIWEKHMDENTSNRVQKIKANIWEEQTFELQRWPCQTNSVENAIGARFFFFTYYKSLQRHARERLWKCESKVVPLCMWETEHVCIFINMLWAMPNHVASYFLPAGVTTLISCYSSAQLLWEI